MGKSGSQTIPLEFLKFLRMQLLQLSQNPEHKKIRQSGHNCHFYPSIKQIITLGIVINSLSGRIKNHQQQKNFFIFSQSCDLVKTSCSAVIYIHAPQDGGISLMKRFSAICSSACFFFSMTSSLCRHQFHP